MIYYIFISFFSFFGQIFITLFSISTTVGLCNCTIHGRVIQTPHYSVCVQKPWSKSGLHDFFLSPALFANEIKAFVTTILCDFIGLNCINIHNISLRCYKEVTAKITNPTAFCRVRVRVRVWV